MIIIYHYDSDGKTAAREAYTNNDRKDTTNRVVFIEMKDHDVPLDIDNILPGELVYILDYSISPEDMLRLMKVTTNVVWIDHHASAIKKYSDFPYHINGLRLEGVSGALLTYVYLHEVSNYYIFDNNKFTGDSEQFRKEFVNNNIPLYIRLVDDWDVWRHKLGIKTKYLQMIFHAYDFKIDDDSEWNKISYPDKLTETLNVGATIYKYKVKQDRDAVLNGEEIELEGKKFYAINTPFGDSTVFDSLENKDKYFGFCVYYRRNGQWKFSLYANSTEPVLPVAEKFGGGGHPNACGFTLKELPF